MSRSTPNAEQHARFIAKIKSNDPDMARLGINMSNVNIGDEQFKEIAEAIKENTTAREFNCMDTDISPIGLGYLVEALKTQKNITTVGFDSNQLGSKGAKILTELLDGNEAITYLCVRANEIGDVGAGHLGQALGRHGKVSTINLRFNQITDAGVVAFAEGLGTNKTLRNINLSQNQVGDVGAEALASFLEKRGERNFSDLNLSNNQIGQKGFGEIIRVLESGVRIYDLDLERNVVGPEGAKTFAAALGRGAMHVSKVNLSVNKIGDEGTAAINENIRSASVQDLLLHDPISPKVFDGATNNSVFNKMGSFEEYMRPKAAAVAVREPVKVATNATGLNK